MEFVKHPLIRENTVESRLYQENLCVSALEKGSTLIVAPTALGKTVVAVLVSAHRLGEGDSKVLFLAPTKPLAYQHLQSFKRFLTIDSFALLTGETPVEDRVKLWEDSRVIFATPQTVKSDLLSGRISLKKVNLMVVDEAHRAVGDYAYVFLGDLYNHDSGNPLVLALTASPGSTREKILEVCENLKIKNIEIRTENDEDVRPYIHEREVLWMKIAFPPELAEVRDLLKKFIDERVEKLKGYGVLHRKPVRRADWIELQRRFSVYAKKNPVAYTYIKEIAAVLKVAHALTLVESQSVGTVHSYLEKFFTSKEPLKSEKLITGDLGIRKAYDRLGGLMQKEIEHPKVPALLELVRKELESGAGRLIVFCQYRDMAREIESRLKKVGIAAKRFVGQATREEDKGLSQKEQAEIIKLFSGGDIKVLVATSVAEEGLDIPSVDTVIFYEAVPSEIRLIQRSGRAGRKESGRVIVLTSTGTSDEGFYFTSLRREKTMKRLLGSVGGAFAEKNKQKTLSHFAKKAEDVFVYVDTREQEPGIINELANNGVKIKEIKLEVGDFLLSDRVVVERKTCSDFVSSLVDGRLFRQAGDMKNNFEYPLIIVEGPKLYGLRNIHDNAIRGAITSLSLDYAIPVIRTEDVQDTVLFLVTIAKREQLNLSRPVRLRGNKRTAGTSELQQFLVEGLPMVGPELAKGLLREFKTPEKVFTAGEKDLKCIENLGDKKAKEIRKILTAEYEP